MEPDEAARAAAEDAAASGGFDDDLADEPVLTPEALAGPEDDDDDLEEIEAPEGARDPDAVKNAIKAERKAAREANAKARDLEARLRELEAAQAPSTGAEVPAETQAREAAEVRALKLEVALDKGLSKTLAERLQGATREEIEADADALLAEVGTRRTSGGMDGGYRQDPPPAAIPPEKAHNAFVVGLLSDVRSARQ